MLQTTTQGIGSSLSQTDRIVAVGASAGGMRALRTLLAALPASFPWPLVLVQHLYPATETHLPTILGRASALSIKLAETGDRLQAQTVYIAPPDHHMTVTPRGTLALNHDPAVNFSRPAIDVLFQSVAAVYGAGAIAIILTGANTDGAIGLAAVKAAGGLTLAQTPETAEASRMPEAAIQTGAVDEVMDIPAIAAKLIALTAAG